MIVFYSVSCRKKGYKDIFQSRKVMIIYAYFHICVFPQLLSVHFFRIHQANDRISFVNFDIYNLTFSNFPYMAPKGAQKVKDEDSVSSERSDQKLGSASPKDIKQANVPAVAAVGASKYCPYIIGALVILIITGGVYYYKYRGYEVVYDNKRFDFYSLCPAIYAFQNVSAQSSNKDLYDAYIQKYRSKLQNTYIVTAKAGQTLTDKDQKYSELRIRYCGLAKKGNGTCENDAIFMCSNPGPYFDVQENQQIKVVWINDYINLNQPNNSKIQNSYDLVQGFSVNQCFNQFDDPDPDNRPLQMCNKTAKSREDFDLLLFDPTNKIPVDTDCQVQNIKQVDTFPVQSTRYAVPLSPHVHGLEVEPYYDGNPLSWFDSNGNIGIGYYVTKADEEDYIKNQVFKSILKQLGIRGMNMKVNVYKNVQQPGTLWYHDHSMGVTGLNVMLGLHSFYVIRNKKAEKDLPSGQFQRMILMYTGMRNQSSTRNCSKQCDPNFSSDQCNQCLIKNKPNKDNEDVPLLLNTTYRIRILNGDFRQQFDKIRFIFSNCSIKQNNISTSCTEQIPFSVIGTDSTLRRYPVHNVNQVSLSPAERIDILITINPQKVKFSSESKLHVISKQVQGMNDISANNLTKLAEYNVTNKRKGKAVHIKQIDVPWVDLSKVDESQIIGKRMRSLFFTSDFTFGINFHPRFSEGLSENPKIGTIQDWYIINTVFQPHPIHVHLIQYQAIQIVALKNFKSPLIDSPRRNCTYYSLDAIKRQAKLNRQNGIPVDKNLNQSLYSDLNAFCYYVVRVMNQTLYSQLFKHKKDEQTFVNGVSGFDVFEKCASAQQCLKYGEKEGSTNMYKYIDPSVNMSQYLQEYQKGWKESFWAPQLAYTKLRLRWTSTDFPQQLMNPLNPQKSEQGCKRGYFHLPQENITQSPGYVYHCHILDHEDKQMMRPIMVQPSGCNNIPTWRERWQEKYCQFKEKKLQRSRKKKANGELRVL